MAALFRKVDCISLQVRDLEAALRFYREALGHELVWRTDEAAGLRLGDSDTELVLRMDDRPMETDITVASVPEAVEAFVQAGGRVVAGPFPITIGLCAVIEDPWHNVLVILDQSRGLLKVDENKRVIG